MKQVGKWSLQEHVLIVICFNTAQQVLNRWPREQDLL